MQSDLLRIIRREKSVDFGELLRWSPLIRHLTRAEALIENKMFEVNIVKYYAEHYMLYTEKIFEYYDKMTTIGRQSKNERKESAEEMIEIIYDYFGRLFILVNKVNVSNEIISEIMAETWEPLPDDENENNVESIVISSETRNVSLNDVASDVGNLNNFFENICRLISSDQNLSDNVYLRRVETGSLLVAVSCAMQAAPIIAFIFWCVKLYQKAEKRYLDNADNKLKVINDSLNIAKEILKIDPENKEADEIIQKCGVSVLNFLENNPTGTINGERYDIGMEKPKIEDKENK